MKRFVLSALALGVVSLLAGGNAHACDGYGGFGYGGYGGHYSYGGGCGYGYSAPRTSYYGYGSRYDRAYGPRRTVPTSRPIRPSSTRPAAPSFDRPSFDTPTFRPPTTSRPSATSGGG